MSGPAHRSRHKKKHGSSSFGPLKNKLYALKPVKTHTQSTLQDWETQLKTASESRMRRERQIISLFAEATWDETKTPEPQNTMLLEQLVRNTCVPCMLNHDPSEEVGL